MSKHGTATFANNSWDEKPYDEFEGRKLTTAKVVYTYTGDIEGEGRVEYLMAYGAEGKGNYVGLERITGSIAGRKGSFVVQHTGTFDATGVYNTWFVTQGSGSGELAGLTASGSASLIGHGPYPITFEYDFGA